MEEEYCWVCRIAGLSIEEGEAVDCDAVDFALDGAQWLHGCIGSRRGSHGSPSSRYCECDLV